MQYACILRNCSGFLQGRGDLAHSPSTAFNTRAVSILYRAFDQAYTAMPSVTTGLPYANHLAQAINPCQPSISSYIIGKRGDTGISQQLSCTPIMDDIVLGYINWLHQITATTEHKPEPYTIHLKGEIATTIHLQGEIATTTLTSMHVIEGSESDSQIYLNLMPRGLKLAADKTRIDPRLDSDLSPISRSLAGIVLCLSPRFHGLPFSS